MSYAMNISHIIQVQTFLFNKELHQQLCFKSSLLQSILTFAELSQRPKLLQSANLSRKPKI